MKPGFASTTLAIVAMGVLSFALFPPSVSATAVAGKTVVDPSGREVTIPLKPSRAILMTTTLADYAFMGGDPRRIAAVGPYNLTEMANAPVGKILPQYNRFPTFPVVGVTGPYNPENLILAHPDVVSTFFGPATTNFLEKIKMPGLLETAFVKRPYESAKLPGIAWQISLWGMTTLIAGQEKRAADMLQRHDREDRELLAAIPHPAKKVKVLEIWPWPDGSIVISSENTGFRDDFYMLGADDPGLKDKLWNVRADPELLMTLDPDVLFIFRAAADRDVDATPARVMAIPTLQTLSAVRNERVYRVPSDAFLSEVVDGPILRRWFAEIIYPNAMPHELRTEYRNTYRDVLGYSLSDDEIDNALLLKENGQSYGYNRFARD